ncbi:MAG TPA: tripartite tricarboxylate transporter substrate binding protein, partial [Burkholderiales bacterium]|nr:tripartite tricarboxylate transporter substrate binding protein [Burkholderiales bacterium]
TALAAQQQQSFPSKPIRMLVPFSPGSQTDILARWVGEKMTENWAQQVVVDNRPSAGGTIASQYVLAANPDGHTLMMVSTGHAGNATLYSKLPYDTIKDFSGVSRVASVPNLLVVSPSLGVKTVKELIVFAKSKPGQINFSSAGIGSGTQINGEMFKLAAGIEATHVPYKGAPEALTEAITGRVHFNFSPVLVAAGQVKAGKAVALAVSTATRSPMFPNLPTIAEAGIAGFEYDQWYGLLASAKTPRPLVNTVNKEVVRILSLPDMKERFLTQGATPAPTTPEEFDRFIRSEVQRFAKVLIAAGARIN